MEVLPKFWQLVPEKPLRGKLQESVRLWVEGWQDLVSLMETRTDVAQMLNR